MFAQTETFLNILKNTHLYLIFTFLSPLEYILSTIIYHAPLKKARVVVSPENGIAQAKRRERSHARERARDQHLLLAYSGENNINKVARAEQK